MQLGSLLEGIIHDDFNGNPDLEIDGLAQDSRRVRPGDLFVAVKGHVADGHNFIEDAVKNGAAALVVESSSGLKWVDRKIPLIRVRDSRDALSKIAVTYYDSPFNKMNLIGITGTNGKTTTSYLLESILLRAGARPGVIGTINYHYSDKTQKASVTTPGPLELMSILRNMADAGVTDVVMEVSSHALDQQRTKDCPFRVAVFTNISRDHLDYHASMEEYFKAKSLLFRDLKKNCPDGTARAVINLDDPRGEDLRGITDAGIITYGLKKGCEVTVRQVDFNRKGLTARLITPVGEADISSSLIGDFNIYNIMAASAAALSIDIDLIDIVRGIADLKGVPGRLELIKNRRSLTIICDYAHTPDALLKAIRAVKPLARGRVITVFGCGGDRDRGKRPKMGRIAGEESDLIIITSDNPRTEDPVAIARMIEDGMRVSGRQKLQGLVDESSAGSGYLIELDRENAIRRAVDIADKDDLILIAGKGHEDYQITGKTKRAFDDRKIAAEAASRGN